MSETEKIKERWEKAYKEIPFAELPWETNKPERELIKLIKKGKIKRGKVLDICCGSGTHSIYLAKKGFDITGIDVSSRAIKIARQRAKENRVKIKFLVGNALNLKLKNSSFDFIFDRGCFHHMPPKYRRKYIKDIYRILKPKGKYLLMCFSDRNLWDIENVFSLKKIKAYFSYSLSVFSSTRIKSHFSGPFRILEAKEITHAQPDGEKVILWSVLMEKG